MRHQFLLSHLVPDAAERDPDGTAVICDDDTLTWAELDLRVGRLAAGLIELGVQRGDRVGIHLHKSIESLVAVHGILRAGAAYVPIDPLAPAELVVRILDDCGITTLVTHEPRRAGVARLAETAALSAIVGLAANAERPLPGDPIARSWADLDGLDPAPPADNLSGDLAYIMYTSGSTGVPKGIMHTHFSGLSYARMSAAVYQLGPDDRMANFSPLHFDMSTFEVLSGVLAGSAVVIIPEPYLRLPASLTEYIERTRATTLYTVPSLFQQMITRGGLADRDLSAVRWVLPAGEVYPPEPLRRMMRLFPNARFSNVYGPAEVNQITWFHFTEESFDDQPVAIGFASPDAELTIIDEAGDDAGDGPGELIARTSTMMAGYWGRPDLDERGFLVRSGPTGDRQRWYRTGDIVSRNERGELLFHGRRDHQIKIRGNRVELEMVESAVGNLDGVAQAVVGVRADESGDSTLVVRYLPNEVGPGTGDAARSDAGLDEAASIDETAWRRTLSGLLPPYAVPTSFEVVDRFPLTPSGKIDRRTVRADIAART